MEVLYPAFPLSFPVEYRAVEGPLHLGSFRVESFPIHHREESLGYRISDGGAGVVAFSGDTTLDENLFRLVEDTDLAVVELSMERPEDPPVPHVSLEELLSHAGKLTSRRVIFNHLYDDLANRLERHVREKRLPSHFQTAYDGMIVELE